LSSRSHRRSRRSRPTRFVLAGVVALTASVTTAVVTSTPVAANERLPDNCIMLGWYGYLFVDGAAGMCWFNTGFGPNEIWYFYWNGGYWQA
jgi:hypothetical protein